MHKVHSEFETKKCNNKKTWNKWLLERLLQMAEIIGHFFSYELFLNSKKHYTIPNAINELSSLILSAVLIKIDP